MGVAACGFVYVSGGCGPHDVGEYGSYRNTVLAGLALAKEAADGYVVMTHENANEATRHSL